MFKAIYMHTKPLKHSKNIEILTNYIKKHDFSKNLTKVSKWKIKSKTPILVFCMHLRMDVSYLFKNTKPLKSMFFNVFWYFYLPPFCYFMIFSYKKEIPMFFCGFNRFWANGSLRRVLFPCGRLFFRRREKMKDL